LLLVLVAWYFSFLGSSSAITFIVSKSMAGSAIIVFVAFDAVVVF